MSMKFNLTQELSASKEEVLPLLHFYWLFYMWSVSYWCRKSAPDKEKGVDSILTLFHMTTQD